MPTKQRRENIFVRRFLSGYENLSWADASIRWLDQEIDGAIEALATRADGKRLAIEHTVIEPFLGEKRDFAAFWKVFPAIRNDESLRMPGRWLEVAIPVGAAEGQPKPRNQAAIGRGVHEWLREHHLQLREGSSEHEVAIPLNGQPNFAVRLFTKITNTPGKGGFRILRQQMADTLDRVIQKALKAKLKKLIQTEAEEHVLILEREHMNLYPTRMVAEIERQAGEFPHVASVEVWILETPFHERDGHCRFEKYKGGRVISSMNFLHDKLLDMVEDGVFTLHNPIDTDGA